VFPKNTYQVLQNLNFSPEPVEILNFRSGYSFDCSLLSGYFVSPHMHHTIRTTTKFLFILLLLPQEHDIEFCLQSSRKSKHLKYCACCARS